MHDIYYQNMTFPQTQKLKYLQQKMKSTDFPTFITDLMFMLSQTKKKT